MKKLITRIDTLDYPVSLFQTSKHRFTVEYGKQITKGLDYSQAAKEFGLCVMHSAACASKLDN